LILNNFQPVLYRFPNTSNLSLTQNNFNTKTRQTPPLCIQHLTIITTIHEKLILIIALGNLPKTQPHFQTLNLNKQHQFACHALLFASSTCEDSKVYLKIHFTVPTSQNTPTKQTT
jgi:hypothetical protein